MYRFLLPFLFLSSFLVAEESIVPYLTSENDTLSLVDGIVNTYNGKLVQVDKDIEIQGSDPLELIRYYDGGHHFFSEKGYGVGFSFPVLLKARPHKDKHDVLVEQRGGSYLVFKAVKQKDKHYVGKIIPDLFKAGYTNCCEALLRGEPDLHSMQVDGTDQEYIVDLGNGVKRYYSFVAKDSSKTRYYRLVREERGNGTIRHFSYAKNKLCDLTRIWTTNKNNSLTLNWLNFFHGEGYYTATASNGQSVRYDVQVKAGNVRSSSKHSHHKADIETVVLVKVAGSHLPGTLYDVLLRSRYDASLFGMTKIKRPDGRILDVEYDDKERVCKLFISGNKGPLYTFNYQKGFTNVVDALGNSRCFSFYNRRLTTLKEPHRTQHYSWNGQGQLLCHTITDPAGKEISKREYKYDSHGNIVETTVSGNIIQVGSQDKYTVRYVYSQDNWHNLLTENYNGKKEITYTYLPNTNLVTRKCTFADGMFVEREFYQYDGNGILVKKIVDDGSGTTIGDLTNVTSRQIIEIEPQLNPKLPGMTLSKVIKEWHHNPKNGPRRLLRMVERKYSHGDLLAEEKVFDANGNFCFRLLFEYNDKRQLVKEVDALGDVTLYRYDNNDNKIFEEKVGSGKKSRFTYDAANRLIQEKEEREGGKVLITSHTYDPLGNRTSTTDHFGQTTRFQYDSASREISSTDPCGYTERKEYDIQENIISQTDKDGYRTTTVNNLYGDPLEIHYPDGTCKRFIYNSQGYLVKETERDGTFKTYEVDYQGRPKAIKTHGPKGVVQKTEQKIYKGTNLIAEIDSAGNETAYQYDGAGRRIAKIQSDYVTFYEYDPLGRLSRTKTAESVEVREYDNLDRLVEERTEDFSGNVFRKVQYSYDINGNCVSERTYSDENTLSETVTVYNSENLPIVQVDPLGYTTRFYYHYSDHLEKETLDPLGRRKLEVYDPLNRLESLHLYSPNGKEIAHSTWSYDGRGNNVLQQERTLFKGQDYGVYTIRATYNGMGEKTAETEQGKRTTRYTYQHGRLHTLTKPDGVVLTHTYDVLGRLRELVSSDGTIHYKYAYDVLDNLLHAEDVIHKNAVERSYDSLNRLIYEKQAKGFEVRFSYDQQDRLKEVCYPQGSISYNYSPTSLVSAFRYKDNQPLYTYNQESDWRGKIVSCTFPNGEQVACCWDEMGRCSSMDAAAFQQVLYYDAVGNLTEMKVRDPIGFYCAAFTYDDLNQLTSETGPVSNSYEFDSLFNRRSKNEAVCAIDGLNQLTDDTINTYVYDSTGRRIAKGSAQYTYDVFGHLVIFKDGNKSVTYQYDPFGRRIERRDSQGVIDYLYQFDTEIGAYENGSIREFRAIYGEFSPFAMELDGEVYSPLRDPRGNVCVLLDTDGSPVATYRYDAFGEFSWEGTVESSWLFSGQRYDFDTDLYHFTKREYDSSIGRWLTPDPLGFADGPNLYAYVHNNPLIYVDPYGLWGEKYNFSTSLKNTFSFGKDFVYSFPRGFADDASWGATNYLLGKPNNSTWGSTSGYYVGQGASIAASFLYGGAELKAVKVCGKGGLSLGKKAWQLGKSLPVVEKTMKTVSRFFNFAREGSAVQKAVKLGGKSTNVISREGVGKANKVLRQKFKPDPLADGAHSVFRRNPITGKTDKYQTYWKQSNPRNPNPWEKGIRFDGSYHHHHHFNKITRNRVNTPHIHDPLTPGDVRSPLEWEVP